MNMGFHIDDNGTLLKYDGKDSVINIPDGVKVIGEEAFSGNFRITEVDFPKTIESIEENAFKNCENIEVIKIPEGCKKLGCRAFYNCKGLKEIHIPGSVEVIPIECFALYWEYDRIKKVYVGDGCKRIEKGALGWGGSYYLPDTIEFIGDGAMEYCSIYGHYKKVFIDYVMAEEMRSWWYYPSRDEIKKLLPPLVKKFHKEGMKKIAEYKKSIADGKDLIKNSKRELKEIQPICNETYKLYTETTGFFKRKKQAEYWEKYCELNRRITDLKSKINVTSDMDKWYHEQLEEMEARDMSYYEGKALEHLVHREQERVEPMHDTYLYKNKGRPRGFFADEIRDAMNAASAPKTQPATEIIVMPKIDTTDM